MNIVKEQLWDEIPGVCEEIPQLTAYVPDDKKTDSAIIIFPGGGYSHRAIHEGKKYAEFLAENGYTAFVCDYRVFPHQFPIPLLDVRRAVRVVRSKADEYGICKDKIAVMGSSAGGHLAALVSTYNKAINYEGVDAIDEEDYHPNAQILCYPVIKLYDDIDSHKRSAQCLFAEGNDEFYKSISPNIIVSEKTPQAFIWHTYEDECVPVGNSLDYAKALKKFNIPVEMHIFPDGTHGKGLALNDDKVSNHISAWSKLLLKWLKYIDF